MFMPQAYAKHPYANSGLGAALVCGVLVWAFASSGGLKTAGKQPEMQQKPAAN